MVGATFGRRERNVQEGVFVCAVPVASMLIRFYITCNVNKACQPSVLRVHGHEHGASGRARWWNDLDAWLCPRHRAFHVLGPRHVTGAALRLGVGLTQLAGQQVQWDRRGRCYRPCWALSPCDDGGWLLYGLFFFLLLACHRYLQKRRSHSIIDTQVLW